MKTEYHSMSTEQLQAQLRRDCDAPDGTGLPLETVLLICNILAERTTPKHTPEELKQLFKKCLSMYCEEESGTQ